MHLTWETGTLLTLALAALGVLWRSAVQFTQVKEAVVRQSGDVGKLEAKLDKVADGLGDLARAVASQVRGDSEHNRRFEGLEARVTALDKAVAVVEGEVKRNDGEIHGLREWRHGIENERQAVMLQQALLARKAARSLAGVRNVPETPEEPEGAREGP